MPEPQAAAIAVVADSLTILSRVGETDVAAEFAAAAAEYIKTSADAEFATFSAEEVKACTKSWGVTQALLEQTARMQHRNKLYEVVLPFFDQFRAESWEQSKRHLESSTDCIVKGIKFWSSAIVQEEKTAPLVFEETMGFIESLFAQGKCVGAVLQRGGHGARDEL